MLAKYLAATIIAKIIKLQHYNNNYKRDMILYMYKLLQRADVCLETYNALTKSFPSCKVYIAWLVKTVLGQQ